MEFETRTFTSYASDYSQRDGSVSIGQLDWEQQNELIGLIFDAEGDFQSYVLKHDIRRLEAQGLWNIIVTVGLLLERRKTISDFDQRTDRDNQAIIKYLSGTKLWLRLEEAFPPFAASSWRTDYDWSELEQVGGDDQPLSGVDDAALRPTLKGLLSPMVRSSGDDFWRMEYQNFRAECEAGRLSVVVDRGLAVQAFQHSGSLLTTLALVFTGGLIAFIPVMIFVGVAWGVLVFVAALISKRCLTAAAIKWVLNQALTNRDRYRFFVARKMVWGRFVRSYR